MVDCSPLFGYGATGGTWSYRGEGYVSMTVAPEEGDIRLDLAGDIRLGVLGIRCYGRTTLSDGESAYVSPCPGAPAASPEAGRRPPPR